MSDAKYIRKLLLSFTDDELLQFLASMTKTPATTTKATKKTTKQNNTVRWFDKDICALDKEGLLLLEQLESDKRMNFGRHAEEKQLRYLKTLKDMHLSVPDSYRNITDPKKMYSDLKAFSEANDIPTEIIARIIPALLEYISTGKLRPIIFVGEKGSGKTTALKLLISYALQLPIEIIKIPQTDGSHGATGDCGIYSSADCGYIAKARFRHNSMIVAFLIDEIDKPPHRSANSSYIVDELLSITDESNDSIVDDYLQTTIVGLNYCPIFFTANSLENINSLLVDRCMVVKFPNPDGSRIKSICKKYVDKKISNALYEHIEFDYSLMDRSIDSLVENKVTSIRKHQQMVELVLDKTLNIYFNKDGNEPVKVTEEMFKDAINTVSGAEKRRIGF